MGYSFGVTTRNFTLIAGAGTTLREDLELIHNKVSRLARSHLNPPYPALYSLASFFARDAKFDLSNAFVLPTGNLSGNLETHNVTVRHQGFTATPVRWYRPHSEDAP